MEEWIVFYNKSTGEELARISVEGYMQGEIPPTIGLIAFDNNIDESDIEYKIQS